MTRPAELLSLLTARGVRMDGAPGGVPVITSHDVAAALPSKHKYLLLSKYCDDRDAYHLARSWWLMRIVEQAKRDGWKWQKGRLGRLRDLTFDDWLNPQRCRKCKGVGSQVTETRKVDNCPACGGSGIRPNTAVYDAKALGLEYKTYRTGPWPNRAAWARSELFSIESDALYRMGKRLR